ncbi:MAG TPA: hypothetical protein VJS92_15130 [Candidatus Polarisedimenticolaceae bacterium]|nr:hypothetical protein [Candidatus Polarisedimenticolaceae bacterium]
MMTEVSYNKTSQDVGLWIAGIEVTGSNTPSEEAQMSARLATPKAALARKLSFDLQSMGFSPDSPVMKGIAGNMLAYPELGLSTGVDSTGTCSGAGASCCSATTDCFGCCAYGCSGCVVCAPGCYYHDACMRGGGGMCLSELAVATANLFDPFVGGQCTCPE